MKFYQYMYYSFLGLTLFLSHLLCIVVAYQYCLIEHHKTTSFPPYVAFFSAIPFLIGIIVCLIIAIKFKQHYQENKNTYKKIRWFTIINHLIFLFSC